MKRTVVALAGVVALVTLTSCIGIGGTETHVSRPTTGQELIDLKTALDKGAISQAEYERKKGAILAQQPG